jgi:hypothetical protein
MSGGGRIFNLFSFNASTSAGRQPVAAADLNGDGRVDLAFFSGGIAVRLAAGGAGSFAMPTFLDFGGQSVLGDPPSLTAADLDGDSRLDLPVAGPPNGNVIVYLDNGDGTFEPFVQYAGPQSPLSLALGDFNGDGRLDAAAADFSIEGMDVMLQTCRAP